MAQEHTGHRQRILKKLEAGVLLDHEVLEILLFPLLPRRNTNDLAHRLLSAFGSLQGVFQASKEELLTVPGIGKSMAENLYCLGIVYARYAGKDFSAYIGKYEREPFLRFAVKEYESMAFEVMDVYLMNGFGEIIGRRRFCDENPDAVNAPKAALEEIFAERKPKGVLLVHNHPEGSATPSQKDKALTRQFSAFCLQQGVAFCDHIIVGVEEIYSFREDRKIAVDEGGTP